MRYFCLSVLSALTLLAQQSSTYRTTALDANGKRIALGPDITIITSNSGNQHIETTQNLNGHTFVVMKTEDRVVREGPSGRVIERIVQRYDPNGNPVAPEKTVIEEERQAGGGATVTSTTYRGDINGRTQVSERSVTRLEKRGSTENVETVVERPTVNGSFDVVEKTTVVKVPSGNGYQQNSVTYAKGVNGFYEALRQVTEHTEQNGNAVDNTAQYEPGSKGGLELRSQIVRRASKNPDGSQTIEKDWFNTSIPGIAADPSAPPKLREREIVERRSGANGTVVETLSVRRPSLADSNSLGPIQRVSETICKGKCDQ